MIKRTGESFIITPPYRKPERDYGTARQQQNTTLAEKSVWIAVFITNNRVSNAFDDVNKRYPLDITYVESRLYTKRAMLADDHAVDCAFVNDVIDVLVLILEDREDYILKRTAVAILVYGVVAGVVGTLL